MPSRFKRLKNLKRLWGWKLIAITIFVVVVMMLLPLTMAAATNSEIIDIFYAITGGVLDAGIMAYCAATEIQAFCGLIEWAG